MNNFSKMTAYAVADLRRPWGKIHDFLLEFPDCRVSYFSVDAGVGVGVKEVWAPLESVARVDTQQMTVTIKADMDKELVRHLSRLNAPSMDREELKLHRLYRTRPHWFEAHRRNGGPLRKRGRLIRGSSLLGYRAMTRQGGNGLIKDLLFDEKGLSLEMFRLEFGKGQKSTTLDFHTGNHCQLLPQVDTLVVEFD